MQACRPKSPPGLILANTGLAVAILAMAAYAILARRAPETRLATATTAVAGGAPAGLASLDPAPPAAGAGDRSFDRAFERGSLLPWPDVAPGLPAPTYEPPYPVPPAPAYELPVLPDAVPSSRSDRVVDSVREESPAPRLELHDEGATTLTPPPSVSQADEDPAPLILTMPIDPPAAGPPQHATEGPRSREARAPSPAPAGPLFAAPGGGPLLTAEPNNGKATDPLEAAPLRFFDAEAERAGSAPIEELLTDTPTPAHLSKLLAKDVRDAFSLGRHGALFAARSRFVGVLRRVATAKDTAGATDRHSQALAAGLRALDEAEAFVPRGNALETDLDVASIAASHTTPLYKRGDGDGPARWALPQEAIARYHRYAQHKLAVVALGDQAASMALHGLGKTYARLDELGEAPLAGQASLTMYRAAIEAHPGNYLAANELGVGLAKAGRYRAAERSLARAIAGGGTSTVYRNLAVVQQNLGQPQLAAAATARAERMAAVERSDGAFSRDRGVEWVAPDQFSRVADASARGAGQSPNASAPNAAPPAGPAAPPAAPQPGSAKPRRSLASRLMPWRKPSAPSAPPTYRGAPPPAPLANPTVAPVRSQTILR